MSSRKNPFKGISLKAGERSRFIDSIQLRKYTNGKTKYFVKVERKSPHFLGTGSFETYQDACRFRDEQNLIANNIKHSEFKHSNKNHKMRDLLQAYLNFIENPAKFQRQTDEHGRKFRVAGENSKSTKSYKRQHINFWTQHLGHLKPSRVTSSDVSRIRDKYLLPRTNKSGKALAPATINLYITTLSHVFSTAVRQNFGFALPAANPCEAVQMLKVDNRQERVLSREEIQEFLGRCKDHSDEIYLFAKIGLETAMRFSEIQMMKWEEYDFERGSIFIPKTKSGEARTLGFSSETMSLLLTKWADYGHPKSGWIFQGHKDPTKHLDPTATIKRIRENMIKQTGCQHFTFHTTRHTAISFMIDSGQITNLAQLMLITGHKTLRMLKRYAHRLGDSSSKVSEAVNRLQKQLPTQEELELEKSVEVMKQSSADETWNSKKQDLKKLKECYELELISEEVYKQEQERILSS